MVDIEVRISLSELRRGGLAQEKLSLVQEVINKTGPMTSLDSFSLMRDILAIALTSPSVLPFLACRQAVAGPVRAFNRFIIVPGGVNTGVYEVRGIAVPHLREPVTEHDSSVPGYACHRVVLITGINRKTTP